MFATVQGRFWLFSALTCIHIPIFVFPLLLNNGSIPMWFGRFEDSIGIFPEFIDGYNILILPTTGRYFQVSIPINNMSVLFDSAKIIFIANFIVIAMIIIRSPMASWSLHRLTIFWWPAGTFHHQIFVSITIRFFYYHNQTSSFSSGVSLETRRPTAQWETWWLAPSQVKYKYKYKYIGQWKTWCIMACTFTGQGAGTAAAVSIKVNPQDNDSPT